MDNNTISLGENHILVIGELSKVFAWGENKNGQLGISEYRFLDSPACYSLEDSYMKYSPQHVSCGNNFSAIVVQGHQYLKENTGENLFTITTTTRNEENFEKFVIELRLRCRQWAAESGKTLEQLFPIAKVKESTLFKRLTQDIGFLTDPKQFQEFLKVKEIKLPGNRVDMVKFFEICDGYKKGAGVLYILGLDAPIPTNVFCQKLNNSPNIWQIPMPKMQICSKVSCGEDFVIFLTNLNNVFGWGNSVKPVLGPRRALNSQFMQQIKVPELIADINAGQNHILALSVDGNVWTWGSNQYGQLGDQQYRESSTPEQVLQNIKKIYADFNSSAAIDKDDQAWFWGSNDSNKFCIQGDTISQPTQQIFNDRIYSVGIGPTKVILINKLGELITYGKDNIVNISELNSFEDINFREVALTQYEMFAITDIGSLYIWNYSKISQRPLIKKLTQSMNQLQDRILLVKDYEQQFLATEFDQKAQIEQIQTKKAPNQISKVVCSNFNTFAMTSRGEILVCGSNQSYFLAFQDENHTEIPFQIDYFDYISKFASLKVAASDISCSSGHVLVTTHDHGVWGWGSNSFGQLGDGTFQGPHQQPIRVEIEERKIVKVACGERFSLFLDSQGDLFSCGDASEGCLGLENIRNSMKIPLPQQINIPKVKFIASGEQHCGAITVQDQLYMWGNNSQGQIGNGTTDNAFLPYHHELFGSCLVVSCGFQHTLAINTHFNISQWGYYKAIVQQYNAIIPSAVYGLENSTIINCDAGYNYSLAITSTGKIFGWGQFNNGRLSSLENDDNKKNQRPSIIQTLGNIRYKQVACGYSHSAALDSIGQVYTWGLSIGGRLGYQCEERIQKDVQLVMCINDLLFEPENEQDDDQDSIDQQKSIQSILYYEPDDRNDENLRNIDLGLMYKFQELMDFFMQKTQDDTNEHIFFQVCERKMLWRIQQQPFNKKLSKMRGLIPQVQSNLQYYEALISTLQLHPCYIFQLIKRDIGNFDRYIDLVYSNMFDDSRLIDSAISLCNMLLKYELEQTEEYPPPFLLSRDSSYCKLFMRLCCATSQDIIAWRNYTDQIIQNIYAICGDDKYGIDPDPYLGLGRKVGNPVAAFSMNVRNVKARLQNLIRFVHEFMHGIENDYHKKKLKDIFSRKVKFLVHELWQQMLQKYSKHLRKWDHDSVEVIHFCNCLLSLLLEPLLRGIREPESLYLSPHSKEAEVRPKVFKTAAQELLAMLKGQNFGDYHWLVEINDMNNNQFRDIKLLFVNIFFEGKLDWQQELLFDIFEHSVQQQPVKITANARELVHLQQKLKEYEKYVRQGTPSYDPVSIILNNMEQISNIKKIPQNYEVNLVLVTRSLRRDQNIVKCPSCNFLLVRELAPVVYTNILQQFQPVNPNGIEGLAIKLLKLGPKRANKTHIVKYLAQYLNLKLQADGGESQITQDIRQLQIMINEQVSSYVEEKELSKEDAIKLVSDKLDQDLLNIHNNKKLHYKYQLRLSNSFLLVKQFLTDHQQISIPQTVKDSVIFNIEYGGSNREIEKYSDNLSFPIFLNVVRSYTQKKSMSLELYENLKKDMLPSLCPFKKTTMNYLLKRNIVKSCTASCPNKYIQVFIEPANTGIYICASYFKRNWKFWQWGTKQIEQVLFQLNIPLREIINITQKSKSSKSSLQVLISSTYCIDSENTLVLNNEKFIKFIQSIESEAQGYVQNININFENSINEPDKTDMDLTGF